MREELDLQLLARALVQFARGKAAMRPPDEAQADARPEDHAAADLDPDQE
jgi:hypothetical protein